MFFLDKNSHPYAELCAHYTSLMHYHYLATNTMQFPTKTK